MGAGGGSLSDSDLKAAISSYISSSQAVPEARNRDPFSLIQSHLRQDPDQLFHLIILLEKYLTSSQEFERNKSTSLLSELLEIQRDKPLQASQIHHFCIFFCSRLNDYPSIIPSLSALKALVKNQGQNFEMKYRDFNDIFQAIFKELEVLPIHLS